MAEVKLAEQPPEPEAVDYAAFLEASPPGAVVPVRKIRTFQPGLHCYYLSSPDIQLHCDADDCSGTRFFRCTAGTTAQIGNDWSMAFQTYTCRNCQSRRKVFALMYRQTTGDDGNAYKFGELPQFGPPIPSRVISMIGPDRELFIRGRRAENQGLGIGAFAYYRRVVENQWGRILQDITKVAQRLGAPAAVTTVLAAASNETQFSKAVESVKDAIPSVLLIDGHNPITLLHRALSEGLHEQSEEECLELAGSIRMVLTELADRIGQALKDQKELKDAVGKLLSRRQNSKAG